MYKYTSSDSRQAAQAHPTPSSDSHGGTYHKFKTCQHSPIIWAWWKTFDKLFKKRIEAEYHIRCHLTTSSSNSTHKNILLNTHGVLSAVSNTNVRLGNHRWTNCGGDMPNFILSSVYVDTLAIVIISYDLIWSPYLHGTNSKNSITKSICRYGFLCLSRYWHRWLLDATFYKLPTKEFIGLLNSCEQKQHVTLETCIKVISPLGLVTASENMFAINT